MRQAEAAGEQRRHPLVLGGGETAVRDARMHQQRRHGELEGVLVLVRPSVLREELFECVPHGARH